MGGAGFPQSLWGREYPLGMKASGHLTHHSDLLASQQHLLPRMISNRKGPESTAGSLRRRKECTKKIHSKEARGAARLGA